MTLTGDYDVEGTALETTPGVCLQAIEQLFEIANQRKERYQDTLNMTLLEVHGETLTDLVCGTNMAVERGDRDGADNNSKEEEFSHIM